MFKLGLVILIAVITLHVSNASIIQKRSADVALEHIQKLERDIRSLDTRADLASDFVSLLITSILKVVISTACTFIKPYLTLISLFRKTVIVAAVLIVQFIQSVVDLLFSGASDSVASVANIINTVNSTITDALTFVENAGCKA